jgi:hypothetical protein
MLYQFPTSSAFTIHPQDPNDPPVFYPSPLLRKLTRDKPTFPISAQLVYTSQKYPVGNFTGKIVIYKRHALQPKYAGCDVLRHSGAAGVIIPYKSNTLYPGFGEATIPSGYKPMHPFPVFEITLAQNKSLIGWFKNQTKGVFITMENDPNPWKHNLTVAIPTLVIVTLTVAGIILIMATYKLTMILMRDGLCWSVGQLVLIFNILALVTRILWATTNPFGIYNTTPLVWTQISQFLQFAFVISGALLISLYWHERIQRAVPQINPFLNNMRWPFVVICIWIFGFELATSICRSIGLYSPRLVMIHSINYTVIVMSLLIFFLITICRLQTALNKLNKALSHSKKNKVKLANRWVLGLAVGMFIWVVTLLINSTTEMTATPIGFIVLYSIQLTSLNFMVLFQILLIRAPQRPWKWIFFGLCIADHHHSLADEESGTGSMESTNRHTSQDEEQN